MAEGSKQLDKREIKERLRRIRDGIRITKITCTRSVKGRNGDSFVAFSAAYQSVQDDKGGMGGDAHATPEEEAAYVEQGIPIQDAKIARYMLSMECDIAALESAAANGSISPQMFQDSIRGIRETYNKLVLREMGATNGKSSD
jgi:hypothetical protein